MGAEIPAAVLPVGSRPLQSLEGFVNNDACQYRKARGDLCLDFYLILNIHATPVRNRELLRLLQYACGWDGCTRSLRVGEIAERRSSLAQEVQSFYEGRTAVAVISLLDLVVNERWARDVHRREWCPVPFG